MVAGRRFWKMTGSGNDFVFIDGRTESASEFQSAGVIGRVCARGTGVGADGLVILTEPTSQDADLALTYYNTDGSLASLCGNATLCTAALGVRLRAVDSAGFGLETGSGVLRARMNAGLPEFDLPAIEGLQQSLAGVRPSGDEIRLGFATAGIPHVVIQVPDVANSDVFGRGGAIRNDPSFAAGTNVNFVSRTSTGVWKIRTYERGVEGETLACGTGSVASAVLLSSWGEIGSDVELETASGQVLGIRTDRSRDGVWRASLRGEGRLVFEGTLEEL
ncbi:MAG: diaminopimelate epimerase [Gemmatimonadaceae bacterium]